MDDQVHIGDPASGRLDFGTGLFTFGLWVFATGFVNGFDIAWFKGGSSTSIVGYDMELGSGDWDANLNDGTSGRQSSFGAGVTGTWVRLFAVVDRSSNQLLTYRDGVLMGTKDITGLGSLSSTVSALVGDFNGTPSSPLKGMI